MNFAYSNQLIIKNSLFFAHPADLANQLSFSVYLSSQNLTIMMIPNMY